MSTSICTRNGSLLIDNGAERPFMSSTRRAESRTSASPGRSSPDQKASPSLPPSSLR